MTSYRDNSGRLPVFPRAAKKSPLPSEMLVCAARIFGTEFHCHAVHAIALAARGRPIVEYVPQVTAAAGAVHFRSRNDHLEVRLRLPRRPPQARRSWASRCRSHISCQRRRVRFRSRHRRRCLRASPRSAAMNRAARSLPSAARGTAHPTVRSATPPRSSRPRNPFPCPNGRLSECSYADNTVQAPKFLRASCDLTAEHPREDRVHMLQVITEVEAAFDLFCRQRRTYIFVSL